MYYLIEYSIRRVRGHARGDMEQGFECQRGQIGRRHTAAAPTAQPAREAHVALQLHLAGNNTPIR